MRTRRKAGSNGLSESPHIQEALQVAYYHCILEMPLKTIAELLGKSPATITRRLDEVRQAGWLRDHPEFTPPPEIWKDLQARMTCTDVEIALKTYFGPERPPRISVLPSPPARPGEDLRQARPEVVERIGLFAARRLADSLGDGDHVVGVNWGWSVRQAVVNLRPARPNPNVRFVPIVGSLSLDERDPHFDEAIECSANRLAQLAASAFDAPRSPRVTTPAYIPRRFHRDPRGLRAIRDFVEGDVSYLRIFGGKDENGARQPGLMDQVDTLVTGLSSIDVDILPVYRPHLITQEDIPILQRAGVVGDLALHLIVESEEMDRNSPERQLVETINSLIVGAEPSDFVKVADRARRADSQGLGVVVLSVGAWKARILTTAIRMGAVTELITDMDTALAIARHVGVHVPSRASVMRVRQ